MDLNKHIWEGWTVQHFIDHLKMELDLIQSGDGLESIIDTREQMKKWCMSNQPYYKKYVKEVVDYFCNLYSIN